MNDGVDQLCGGIPPIHDEHRLSVLFCIKGFYHILGGISFTGLAASETSIHDHAVEQIVQAGNQRLDLRCTLRGLAAVNFLQLLGTGQIQPGSINAE